MATISKIKNKKSYSYRARVRVVGHKPISRTFSQKTIAKNWAGGIESKLKNNQSIPELEAKKHTFFEVAEKYIFQVATKNKDSLPRKVSHLGIFKKHIGDVALSNLTKLVLTDSIHKISTEESNNGKPRKPSTVNRYISTLNHCLNHCVNEWEWIAKNPLSTIEKPTEPPGRIRFLSPEELTVFLNACKKVSKQIYVMALLAVSCGMRKSEILRMSYKTFDPENNCVINEITKNGEIRKSYIFGPAHDCLMEYLSKRSITQTTSFFGGTDNKNIQQKYREFIKAKKLSGIQNFNFHDLRHTCASYLAMANASLKDIAEVLGHKTIKMANRYSHLSETHVKDIVKNLSENVINQSHSTKNRKIS